MRSRMGSCFLVVLLLAIAIGLYMLANPSVYYAASDRVSTYIQTAKKNPKLSWLGDFFSARKNQKVSNTPILMYHHVKNHTDTDNEVEKGLSVTVKNFSDQIRYLRDNGYKTISLDELFTDGGQKSVVITFDDGYKDVIENAYPVLKKYNFRATVFVITDFVGKDRYMDWNDLKTLKKAGWRVESHTLNHPNLTNIGKEEAKKQIYESKLEIENNLNYIVTFLSYPAGEYNKNIIELIKEVDYAGAVSTDRGIENSTTNIYALKRERVGGYSELSDFIGLLK